MRNHKTIKIPSTTDDEYKTFAKKGILKVVCDQCGVHFHSKQSMERHKALHCDKTYEKHACIDAESNELYRGEVLDIIDTRGDSDNRLFLVYWGQEIEGRKRYLVDQEFLNLKAINVKKALK